MNRFLIISLLISLSFARINAQVILKNKEQISRFNGISQERIFAHTNTSLFLSGEYLYYKIYCIDQNTKYLSSLSKIAYVVLISENGEQLFKQKIKLKNGVGSGDFFLPVSIQTGSYKLLAYTNWMMNDDIDTFFQQDIHIINPYQVTQSSQQTFSATDSSGTITKSKPVGPVSNGPLALHLNSQVFKTRSKVSMTFQGKNKNSFPDGVYSISVRKRDQLPLPLTQSMVTYLQNFKQPITKVTRSNPSIYLPELRGELISGKVTTTTNNSIKNLKIVASIPGENYFIAIAKTDAQGNFYLNIKNDYEGDRIFLEILDKPYRDYDILINEQPSLNYTKLQFENLKLNSSMANKIVQRSIHNQIENAYFKYKPDSTLSKISEQLFDGKQVQLYKLDDFTRFKTVRETIFEIVKDVSITKTAKSAAFLRIQGYNFGTNSGILPLVIIDGLQITNHSAILDYNASQINTIMVYRDRFVVGTKLYQGALLLTTKNNTIDIFQKNPALFSFNLLRPELRKKYFTQQYVTTKTSRIPDDRMQLVWMPHLTVNEKTATFDFYTSDVTGDFEICIEGFTSDQKPISIRSYFSVQN